MDVIPVPAPVCPKCHQTVEPIDFFCRNCGTNLKAKPPDTSILAQLMLYVGSALLPPLGIIWAWRYLRQKDTKSRIIGLAAVVITIIELVVIAQISVSLVNTVNEQVYKQTQNLLQY